jgi:hypothetical protein
MVKYRRRRMSERGASRVGCLFFLMVVVAIGYWGVPIAATYVRLYRFKSEMQSQARFAPSIDNGTIRRRLVQRIEALGLPDEAKRLRILRVTTPREIRISTSWEEEIVLPFLTQTVTFNPEVRVRM